MALAAPWAARAADYDGAREYAVHCAVCHGDEGKGDGPMADLLLHRPKDLTVLSRKNGGSFPETVVYQIVDGRRLVLFHGTREMPVWGDRFRDGASEDEIDARIGALVGYVESLQVE